MRYKVGDKVVIRDDLDVGTKYYVNNRDEGSLWVNGMKDFIGEQEISSISSFRYRPKPDTQPEWAKFNFTDEMIDHEATAKLNEVKPVDLIETGMIVEIRNGSRYLVLKGDFEVGGYGRQNMAFVSPTGFINITAYDEYLKYKGEYSKEYDVVKVYKTRLFGLNTMLELRHGHELIWGRNPEPKEPKVITYTTKELMAKLGLDGDTEIKIVDKK